MLAVLVGVVLGFLSGLGVGGGSLLLLWLSIIVGEPWQTARLINLMFFLPCAAVATLYRRRRFKADGCTIVCAVLAGLAGALLGNRIGPQLDKALLQRAFGILFLLCGIRELRFRPEREKP